MTEPDEKAVQEAGDAIYRSLKGVKPGSKRRRTYKPRSMPYAISKGTRTSPVKSYVRSLGKDLKTVGEVAEELGISESYVRKLSDGSKVKAPTYVAPFGQYEIRIYTPQDVEELREHLHKRRPGLQEKKA